MKRNDMDAGVVGMALMFALQVSFQLLYSYEW